jgi:hypothetical protein
MSERLDPIGAFMDSLPTSATQVIRQAPGSRVTSFTGE